MTLRFLAIRAEYVISLPNFFNFMEFPEAILQVNVIFIYDFLILGATVMQYFIWLCVVVIFNELWVPFNWKMAFLEEVLNEFIDWWQNTAVAHFHPITLRTCIPWSIYSLKHEWFETFLFRVDFVHPIWLFPPSILLDMINWTLFKQVLSHSPHFFINSSTSWLKRKHKDDWRR